jgi:hypothetical protein
MVSFVCLHAPGLPLGRTSLVISIVPPRFVRHFVLAKSTGVDAIANCQRFRSGITLLSGVPMAYTLVSVPTLVSIVSFACFGD